MMKQPLTLLLALVLATTALRGVSAQPQDSLKPEPKAKPAEPQKLAEPARDAEKKDGKATDPKATVQPAPARREKYTAESNPTKAAGRGDPDLDNPHQAAAWILIEGKSGKYKEEGGQKLLQWYIDEPVCASPTFRVEAFEPLLGTPKDFKAILRTVESADGTDLVYAIAANEGAFEVGKDYPLLGPGENFVIRNGMTGDVVKEIAPLSAGQYAILAGIKNAGTGKETLAVTYFTVKSDEE